MMLPFQITEFFALTCIISENFSESTELPPYQSSQWFKSKTFKMGVAISSAVVSGISLLMLFYERCREKNKPECNKWSWISFLISCE